MKKSSGTQVNNCGDFPTLAQAALQEEVERAAKEELASRKAQQQSNAAAEAQMRKAAKSAWEESLDKNYAGAATWSLFLKKAKAPAKAPAEAPAKDPAEAPAKDPAPAPADQGWTMVGPSGKPIGPNGKPNGFKKEKKPKAQPWGAPKAWLPPDKYIAFLKGKLKVLNHEMHKAKRDNKSKDAEDLQRQINRLWGKMKRAEERLRQSGCRRWNAQQGGLRKEHTLGDYFKSKRK
jgi:hypothetical protein